MTETDHDSRIHRAQEHFSAGAVALNARRMKEAGRAFRSGLEEAWDTGTRTERRLCVNLATVCLSENLLYEGFLVAWRSMELAKAAGERDVLALSLRHIAGFYMVTTDIDRLEAAIRMADRHVDALPDTLKTQVLSNLEHYRGVVARHRGDRSGAIVSARISEATGPEEFRAYAREFQCGIHLDEGHYEAAEELARSALEVRPLDAAMQLRLEFVLVQCRFQREGRETGLRAASDFLDALGAQAKELSHASVMRAGERAGRWLTTISPSPFLARRAFDLAGTAALERTRDLERFKSQFPDLRAWSPEALAILDDHRRRYEEEHEDLLRAVARTYEQVLSSPPTFEKGEAGLPEPVVCVCAWCRRARGPESTWLSFDDIRLPDQGLQVSHGICERCLEENQARIASGRTG